MWRLVVERKHISVTSVFSPSLTWLISRQHFRKSVRCWFLITYTFLKIVSLVCMCLRERYRKWHFCRRSGGGRLELVCCFCLVSDECLSGRLKRFDTCLWTGVHSHFYATTPTAPSLSIRPKFYKQIFLSYQIAISNHNFFSADYVSASG